MKQMLKKDLRRNHALDDHEGLILTAEFGGLGVVYGIPKENQ